MALHVFCEVFLASCCALAAASSWRRSRACLASLGFALIGLAALLGAVVYAGIGAAAPAHDGSTFLAARLGLLLIAAQSLHDRRWTAGVVLLGALNLIVSPPLDQAIAVLALVAIAWKGRSRHWPLAIAGSLLFALAGLLVGTRGEWFSVPRVDLFHLGLGMAVLAWWRARLSSTR